METTSKPERDSGTGSRKSFNYHWRIFIPLVATLWLALTAVAYFQVEIRRQSGYEYLLEIVTRIDAYVNKSINRGEDPVRTLDFVDSYLASTLLNDICISVYDNHTGKRIAHTGFELPAPDDAAATGHTPQFYHGTNPSAIAVDNNGQKLSLVPDKAFYSSVNCTDDGRFVIQLVMPYNMQVSGYRISNVNAKFVLMLLVVGLFMSLFAYFFTRHLSKNIILLRNFANRAAHDSYFVDTDKFPNDELGEISRQIVHIYNSRTKALRAREQEHLVALRATQERARIKRQLTNNINHELKTPTVIIRGYIDTILSDPGMPDATRTRFLEKAKAQVERLVQMLSDISTLTRLEDGNQSIQTEPVNMHDLLFTVANDLHESNVMDDIEFIYDIPDDCIVRGSEALLTGMFMNLAKNSIAYAKCSAMGCRLLASNDRYYTFSFWDNGVGVPPEHLPHLFERFFRIDTGRSRKNGGTGLGLPIVKNTVNSLGGSIVMRNRKEGGLECVFTLMRWDATAQPADETEDAADGGTAGD